MLVSVIIRTRNEERWIGRCLLAVTHQSLVDVEAVLVDNESTDRTREIAREYRIKECSISRGEFTYGRALNLGIQKSLGRYVAILSGHCIPADNYWLAKLLANFQDPGVAGVYGRQEPMLDTSSVDKRDLWTTFGIERRVQRKDPFFHNANCMIRRSVWERQPFDETVNGVEDRVWAKQVLADGYTIVYEPAASVFHHHGIHQGRDDHRADRVVQVIEMNLHGKGEGS